MRVYYTVIVEQRYNDAWRPLGTYNFSTKIRAVRALKRAYFECTKTPGDEGATYYFGDIHAYLYEVKMDWCSVTKFVRAIHDNI